MPSMACQCAIHASSRGERVRQPGQVDAPVPVLGDLSPVLDTGADDRPAPCLGKLAPEPVDRALGVSGTQQPRTPGGHGWPAASHASHTFLNCGRSGRGPPLATPPRMITPAPR